MNVRAFVPVLMVAGFLAFGCGDEENPPPPITGIMPDFSLTDVNPNSATVSQFVSPRDFQGKISAYYFGAAT